MKQILFLILFIALCSNTRAQSDNKIVIGKIDTIQSTILGEKRDVWVYMPGDGGNDIFAKQRYPVVYLLDGDAHFFSVVGMIQQLSSVNGNMICPEMIVVSIPNTDRWRDLTPTHVAAEPPLLDSASGSTTGGGEKFISFMEKELMPYIESKYPTEPYKMFIGHSLGGLMVMQALVHHSNLFNAYIAIDPSMWWDKQHLLKQAKKIISDNKFQGRSLFLAIANTMDEGMTIDKVSRDTSYSTNHIRSILELRSYLDNNKKNGLKFQSKYYNDDSHGSVPMIAEYDALHFFFDFYPLKLGFKDYTDTTAALVDKYEKHFANVSKQMGYKIRSPENQLNGMGYQALAAKQFNKAERFFKYNIASYPQSWNVYDSMGDYYEAVGDKANAIDNFKKALIIKENADTRKKLENLQKK